jgi:uncharacterized protein
MSDVSDTLDQPPAPGTTANQATDDGLAPPLDIPGHFSGVEPLPSQQPLAPELPPVPRREPRVPHFGHVLLMLLLLLAGLICAVIAALIAVHFHAFGVSGFERMQESMAYNLGIMAVMYLAAFGPAAAAFPPLWRKSFLAGLQWCAQTASRFKWRLIGLGLGCAGVALILQSIMHLPRESPIQKMLNTPTAAWLMFAFGVTVAPFCEEVIFRGFLLPSACTALDWTLEKLKRSSPPGLLANGHPKWSFPAMIFGAATTSVLFALMHAAQTSNSKAVFVMLWSMSMVLSTVRLKTRSLAASTLTHATYNFTLFLMVFIGTHGFHNLQK